MAANNAQADGDPLDLAVQVDANPGIEMPPALPPAQHPPHDRPAIPTPSNKINYKTLNDRFKFNIRFSDCYKAHGFLFQAISYDRLWSLIFESLFLVMLNVNYHCFQANFRIPGAGVAGGRGSHIARAMQFSSHYATHLMKFIMISVEYNLIHHVPNAQEYRYFDDFEYNQADMFRVPSILEHLIMSCCRPWDAYVHGRPITVLPYFPRATVGDLGHRDLFIGDLPVPPVITKPPFAVQQARIQYPGAFPQGADFMNNWYSHNMLGRHRCEKLHVLPDDISPPCFQLSLVAGTHHFTVWRNATNDPGVLLRPAENASFPDSILQYFITGKVDYAAAQNLRQNTNSFDAYRSTYSLQEDKTTEVVVFNLLRIIYFSNQPWDTVTNFVRVRPAYDVDTPHCIRLSGEQPAPIDIQRPHLIVRTNASNFINATSVGHSRLMPIGGLMPVEQNYSLGDRDNLGPTGLFKHNFATAPFTVSAYRFTRNADDIRPFGPLIAYYGALGADDRHGPAPGEAALFNNPPHVTSMEPHSRARPTERARPMRGILGPVTDPPHTSLDNPLFDDIPHGDYVDPFVNARTDPVPSTFTCEEGFVEAKTLVIDSVKSGPNVTFSESYNIHILLSIPL